MILLAVGPNVRWAGKPLILNGQWNYNERL